MKIIVSNVHFLGNQVNFVESNRDKPACCVASSCYIINCMYTCVCDQWLSMVIPIDIWGHSGCSDKEEAPQGFTNIIIYVNFIAIIIKQSKWFIWQYPLKGLNFASKRLSFSFSCEGHGSQRQLCHHYQFELFFSFLGDNSSS